MTGICEQLGLLRNLDNAAEIHHGDAVADMGHDGEIMRDEQIRKIVLALQVDQQIDHLGLDRDVERQYRLVANDQAGPERQRASNADALPLPAGELVGIIFHLVRAEPDLMEQFGDALLLFAAGRQTVHAERLTDDIASRHARIERGKRVLEDDLHRTPMRTQFGFSEIGDVAAVDPDAAPGWLNEAQDAPRDRRFAATGFADKPERFSDANRKTDAVHRMHGADFAAKDAAAHRVLFDEVRHLEQSAHIGHGDLAVSAARQHAAKWFSSHACSGGYSSRQRAITSPHLGAKAQPFGRLVNEGTMPGISTSGASALVLSEGRDGIEAIRPRV